MEKLEVSEEVFIKLPPNQTEHYYQYQLAEVRAHTFRMNEVTFQEFAKLALKQGYSMNGLLNVLIENYIMEES